MNVVWHNHVTTKRSAEILDATSSIGFDSGLCFRQIWNRPPISSAERDKIDWISRKDYLQTLGAAFDHASLVSGLLRAGETPASTNFCATSVAQLFFELPFAIVQRLQPQLPAVQLNRELINVAGDFGALRFVLFQFSAKLFGVGESVRARTLRRRHGSLLSAFLTGQIHSRRRTVRDQCCFAMLAIEEDIGIGRDFARRMFRRFHSKRASRGCASGTEGPDPKPQAPNKFRNSHHQSCLVLGTPLGFGLAAWDFGSAPSASLWR